MVKEPEVKETAKRGPKPKSELALRGERYGVVQIKDEPEEDFAKRVEAAQFGLKSREDYIAFERAKSEGAYPQLDAKVKGDGITADASMTPVQVKEALKRHIDAGLSVTFTDNGGEMRANGKEDSFNLSYPKEALVRAANAILNPDL